MATYVFSDVHGHAAPLERLFWRVSPSEDDQIFMLGDMIDRGPDPLGVLRFCHSLSQAGDTVLMGNHEDLMLAFLADPDDLDNQFNWITNGGHTTLDGLRSISDDERQELVEWVAGLPLSAHTRVGDILYLFTHAGIEPRLLNHDKIAAAESDQALVDAIIEDQIGEDLMWVRDAFWGRPTGLVGPDGTGTVVVCGHTPTPYLDDMADRPDRPGVDAQGLGQLVKVGACKATGGVADRWDIDAGCAGGHGFGRLLLVRLDDGEEFYEDIGEDE